MTKSLGLRLSLLVAIGLFASACAHTPPYTVVTQAQPNPFPPSHSFVIEPVSYDGLMVAQKSEAAWLASRTPVQQQKWNTDKSESGELLIRGALGHVGPGVALTPGTPGQSVPAGADMVRVKTTFIEPGTFGFGYGNPGLVRTSAQILDSSGKVLDEFWMQSPCGGEMTGIGACLRTGSSINGDIIARYLTERVHPPK